MVNDLLRICRCGLCCRPTTFPHQKSFSPLFFSHGFGVFALLVRDFFFSGSVYSSFFFHQRFTAVMHRSSHLPFVSGGVFFFIPPLLLVGDVDLFSLGQKLLLLLPPQTTILSGCFKIHFYRFFAQNFFFPNFCEHLFPLGVTSCPIVHVRCALGRSRPHYIMSPCLVPAPPYTKPRNFLGRVGVRCPPLHPGT